MLIHLIKANRILANNLPTESIFDSLWNIYTGELDALSSTFLSIPKGKIDKYKW